MTKNLMLLSCMSAAMLISATGAEAAGMLAAKDGMTLYVYDKDKNGVSECYDTCAAMWPPYMAKTGDKMMSGWTEIKRKDGKMQWAYDGKPLYFYQGDKKKGDMAGDGKGGVWHVVKE